MVCVITHAIGRLGGIMSRGDSDLCLPGDDISDLAAARPAAGCCAPGKKFNGSRRAVIKSDTGIQSDTGFSSDNGLESGAEAGVEPSLSQSETLGGNAEPVKGGLVKLLKQRRSRAEAAGIVPDAGAAVPLADPAGSKKTGANQPAADAPGVPLTKAAEVNGDDGSAQADLQLVELAQRGDLQAFRELVTKYQSRAQAVAIGIVGNHHDAEDLIQEAFLKAFRNLKSFRGQSGFYTWFYRIVFNLAIDLGRRKYRKSEIQPRDTQVFDSGRAHSSVDASSYLSRTPGPEEEFDRAELRTRLDQAIGQLSPDHRAVIIMREVEGLSYEEISETLGCSKGTVMSRLHHARKKLQRALGDLEITTGAQITPITAPGGQDRQPAPAGDSFSDREQFLSRGNVERVNSPETPGSHGKTLADSAGIQGAGLQPTIGSKNTGGSKNAGGGIQNSGPEKGTGNQKNDPGAVSSPTVSKHGLVGVDR